MDNAQFSSGMEAKQPGLNARYASILIEFKRRFPKAIPKDSNIKLPFKSGIHMDMMAAGVDPDKIDIFLQMYTRSDAYLKAVLSGSPRIDLQGNIISQITAEEKSHAEELIKRKGDNVDVDGNTHVMVDVHKGKTAFIYMDEGLIDIMEAMHGQNWRDTLKSMAPIVANQIPPEYDLSRAIRNKILKKAASIIKKTTQKEEEE